MIFTDQQKLLVGKLLKGDDSMNDRKELDDLFKKTHFGMTFTCVIFDNISFSHKNLYYVLKTQFEIDKVDAVDAEECLSIYRGVRNNFILPVFRKYEFYSPTMCFHIFEKLYSSTMNYYGKKNKINIAKILDMNLCTNKIRFSEIAIEKELYDLEQTVWKST